MEKFQANKTYSTKSICDSECTFSFSIIKRTAKTVTIKVHNEIVKRGIQINFEGNECFYPLGKYSMAPCIKA
jgi:hypothetical protein